VTNRTRSGCRFPRSARRSVEPSFDGGAITSDAGGALLLRQAERRTKLVDGFARRVVDPRRSGSVLHSTKSMLLQRVFAIALGYEDLNDHHELRHDAALQTAVGRSTELASPSTLSRLEARADQDMVWAFHEVLVEHFIESHDTPPKELILDFDATDDLVHGKQVGRFFHGYYRSYCFLPLYVFCGDFPLFALLRQANIDACRGTVDVLEFLVPRLRAAWPDVRIVLRGDSGFCRTWIMSWCEANSVDFVIGIARNKRLERAAAPLFVEARAEAEKSGGHAKLFGEVDYAAGSWDRTRRIVIKAQVIPGKDNPRFVATSESGDPAHIYKVRYCARGEMENRIKEQQLDMYADRTSSTKWWANQLRLMLSTLAYALVNTIRRVGLAGTKMARAQVGTIRLRLLKIGAVIVRNTRRVRFLMSSSFPDKELFWLVAKQLAG